MVEKNVQIRMKENPIILDKVIQNLQQVLKEKLLWLDKAFGRSYKLVEHRPDGDKLIYPAAYIGNSEYASLLPNDNYGNFCWFDIYDPQAVTTITQSLPQFTFSGAVVFWYNLDSIFADSDVMYTEEIKDEVIKVLTSPGIIKTTGRLTINKIFERFENIYKGYSLEKQFFMHPYSGLRIEFELTTRELCQHYTK